MSEFIKKALGLFVEFDDTPEHKDAGNNAPSGPAPSQPEKAKQPIYNGPMTQHDIDKFTKHFE